MLNPELAEYARQLVMAGFKVYEPKQSANYFIYSQVVSGKECFGSVQEDYFGGYSHLMPIKPSRQCGSSIFVGGDKQISEGLTIEAAKRTAQPYNYNCVVGKRENYHELSQDGSKPGTMAHLVHSMYNPPVSLDALHGLA